MSEGSDNEICEITQTATPSVEVVTQESERDWYLGEAGKLTLKIENIPLRRMTIREWLKRKGKQS